MSAITRLTAILTLACWLGGCGEAGGGDDSGGTASRPSPWIQPDPEFPAFTDPSKAAEQAPESFVVRMEIAADNEAGDRESQGAVMITVTRSWAPHCADRFYNLVKIGYFDGCRFFRVVPEFVAQFGVHGDPVVNRAWQGAAIKDDQMQPGRGNEKGTLAFASAMRPGTRTVQIFINLEDNRQRLDGYKWFPPFARVTEGMEVVANIYDGYGDGPPSGRGPNQGLIRSQGNRYLQQNFPKLHYISNARIKNQ